MSRIFFCSGFEVMKYFIKNAIGRHFSRLKDIILWVPHAMQDYNFFGRPGISEYVSFE